MDPRERRAMIAFWSVVAVLGLAGAFLIGWAISVVLGVGVGWGVVALFIFVAGWFLGERFQGGWFDSVRGVLMIVCVVGIFLVFLVPVAGLPELLWGSRYDHPVAFYPVYLILAPLGLSRLGNLFA